MRNYYNIDAFKKIQRKGSKNKFTFSTVFNKLQSSFFAKTNAKTITKSTYTVDLSNLATENKESNANFSQLELSSNETNEAESIEADLNSTNLERGQEIHNDSSFEISTIASYNNEESVEQQPNPQEEQIEPESIKPDIFSNDETNP